MNDEPLVIPLDELGEEIIRAADAIAQYVEAQEREAQDAA